MSITRNVGAWIFVGAAALAGSARSTAAQERTSATNARIQKIITMAAQQMAAGGSQTPADLEPGAEPQITSRPVEHLSLDDAVKLALERNLDIAVERMNPLTFDFSLAGLRATYRPTLTGQGAAQAKTTAASNTIAGAGQEAGAGVDQTLAIYNGGLTQNLPWGGGGLLLTLNNQRSTTTNQTQLFNPSFNSSWTAQYTQPLLRGFSTDSTRQQLVVTKLNQDISEVQLKSTIVNTLSNVRSAYWDYVYAVQSVDVARQTLALANQLVTDNQTRVEVGTMAPIDVVQAQSQAAAAQQALVAAQATMRTSELALKRLIVNGTSDRNWNAQLDPTDRPAFAPARIDLEAAVNRALGQRTDLAIAKKNLEANDTTLKFLRNQVLPQADLVASYGLSGIGGTKLLVSGSGVGSAREIIGTVPGGYGTALGSLFAANYPTWNVTLNFSYPLGVSTADAAVARARIQVDQAAAQINQIQLQVATDVTNAALQVTSNAENVQAAHAATVLAQQTLDAERSKFDVGMSTNFNVIQFQRDLATAENTELQAVLNYRKSLVEFERLQQTTLSSLGVTVLSSTGGLNTTAVGSGRPTVVAGGS